MLGAVDAQQQILIAVFLISTLLNIAYLLPPVIRAFLLSPPKDDHDDHDDNHATHGVGHRFGLAEAPLFCLVPLSLTAIGTVLLFFFVDPIRGFVQSVFMGGM